MTDDKYRAARLELLLALRGDELKAKGVLRILAPGRWDKVHVNPNFDEQWNGYLEKYKDSPGADWFREYEGTIDIPRELWIEELLDWGWSSMEYSDKIDIHSITLDFASLSECLKPQNSHSETEAQKKSKIGRPEGYLWHEFSAEIAVRADLDNLPETQAELIEQMQKWCLKKWGKEPAPSTIRLRIAPIYEHPRKLKN